MRSIIEESKAHLKENTVTLLVGNKCDLVDKKEVDYETAKVSLKCLPSSFQRFMYLTHLPSFTNHKKNDTLDGD